MGTLQIDDDAIQTLKEAENIIATAASAETDTSQAAKSYNYDASTNQGYVDANNALQQVQANKPSASYDPTADAGYQEAAGALQQAQANKPASSYNAATDAAYQEALAALTQAKDMVPTYSGTYDQQLVDVYNQIVNRDKFSYDLNGDMLYQQYRDQYMNLGQQAMMDAMGQASALTGGYGSSYAQSVGQQTYNNYLNQLNAVIPELYNTALNQYNAEGEALANQYAMLGDLRDSEYGQYRDSISDYWTNLQYLADQAETAYNRGYNDWLSQYNDYWQNLEYLTDRADTAYSQGYADWQNQYNDYWTNMEYLTDRSDTEYSKGYEDWYNGLQMEKEEDETAYNREQDAYEKEIAEQERAWEQQQTLYSNLFQAIAGTGYSAYTDEELAAAGVSRSLADAWLAYYNLINGTSYTSSGSSGSGSSSGSGYTTDTSDSSGSSSGNTSSTSGATASGTVLPGIVSSDYVNELLEDAAVGSASPTTGIYGLNLGLDTGLQGVDLDYLTSGASTGTSKPVTNSSSSSSSSGSSSTSSGNKQTQAGSTSTSSSNKGTTLSESKMAATISNYKTQITNSYGSNLTSAQMNAYLKNKILYSSYSSDQKTQLLKYAGLM